MSMKEALKYWLATLRGCWTILRGGDPEVATAPGCPMDGPSATAWDAEHGIADHPL